VWFRMWRQRGCLSKCKTHYGLWLNGRRHNVARTQGLSGLPTRACGSPSGTGAPRTRNIMARSFFGGARKPKSLGKTVLPLSASTVVVTEKAAPFRKAPGWSRLKKTLTEFRRDLDPHGRQGGGGAAAQGGAASLRELDTDHYVRRRLLSAKRRGQEGVTANDETKKKASRVASSTTGGHSPTESASLGLGRCRAAGSLRTHTRWWAPAKSLISRRPGRRSGAKKRRTRVQPGGAHER